MKIFDFPYSALFHVPKFNLVRVLLREAFHQSQVPRVPESDLIMDSPDAVKAFTKAGRLDGPAYGYYLFYSGRVTQVISGCKNVLDLGTGPGNQLIQLAQINEEINFVGLDLSANMIQTAKDHAVQCQVKNVEFKLGDLTNLPFPENSFDAITSIMTLHHLASEKDLEKAFQEIKRVLKPEGVIFLLDFARLKSTLSMKELAFEKESQQDPLLTRDFQQSLEAAFGLDDFKENRDAFFPSQSLYSTFGLPVMVMIKSDDQSVSVEKKIKINQLVRRLSPGQRRDLDELRAFFALNGLDNDLF